MKHLSLFSLLAMSFLMASCDDSNDDKMEVTASFSQFYTAMNNFSSNSDSYCASTAIFTYEIDYSDGTVDIIANNVSFSPMMPAITMEIDDVPFTYSAGISSYSGIKFSGTNIVPEVGGQKMPDYTITSLSGEIGFISIEQANSAILTMTVNNQYCIAVQPATPHFGYECNSVVSGSTTFTNSDASYQLVYDATEKLVDIYLYNTKFASMMPAMNMVFQDVPFTATMNGVSFSIDELTPYIVGSTGATTPAPNYAISGLSGEVNNGKLNFTFTCSVTAEGNSAAGASYNVSNSATLFGTSN